MAKGTKSRRSKSPSSHVENPVETPEASSSKSSSPSPDVEPKEPETKWTVNVGAVSGGAGLSLAGIDEEPLYTFVTACGGPLVNREGEEEIPEEFEIFRGVQPEYNLKVYGSTPAPAPREVLDYLLNNPIQLKVWRLTTPPLPDKMPKNGSSAAKALTASINGIKEIFASVGESNKTTVSRASLPSMNCVHVISEVSVDLAPLIGSNATSISSSLALEGLNLAPLPVDEAEDSEQNDEEREVEYPAVPELAVTVALNAEPVEEGDVAGVPLMEEEEVENGRVMEVRPLGLFNLPPLWGAQPIARDGSPVEHPEPGCAVHEWMYNVELTLKGSSWSTNATNGALWVPRIPAEEGSDVLVPEVGAWTTEAAALSDIGLEDEDSGKWSVAEDGRASSVRWDGMTYRVWLSAEDIEVLKKSETAADVSEVVVEVGRGPKDVNLVDPNASKYKGRGALRLGSLVTDPGVAAGVVRVPVHKPSGGKTNESQTPQEGEGGEDGEGAGTQSPVADGASTEKSEKSDKAERRASKGGKSGGKKKKDKDASAVVIEPEAEEGLSPATILDPYGAAGTYAKFVLRFHKPVVPSPPTPHVRLRPEDLIPQRPAMPPVPHPREVLDDLHGQMRLIIKALALDYRSLFMGSTGVVSRGAVGAGPEARKAKLMAELKSSGQFYVLKEKLKRVVVRVVREKFHKHTLGSNGTGASAAGFPPASATAELGRSRREAQSGGLGTASGVPQADDAGATEAFYNDLYVYLMAEASKVLTQEACAPTVNVLHGKPQVSGDPQKKLALEAESVGDVSGALQRFLNRIAGEDSNSDLWYDYALFCRRTMDNEKAEGALREGLSCGADHIDCLVLLGLMRLEAGEDEEADVFLDEVSELNPDGWLGHALKALRAMFAGDEKALANAKAAAQGAGDWPGEWECVMLALGHELNRRGAPFAFVKECFAHAMLQGAPQASIQLGMAQANMGIRRWQLAYNSAEGAMEAGGGVVAQAWAGHAAFEGGMWSLASAAYLEVTRAALEEVGAVPEDGEMLDAEATAAVNQRLAGLELSSEAGPLPAPELSLAWRRLGWLLASGLMAPVGSGSALDEAQDAYLRSVTVYPSAVGWAGAGMAAFHAGRLGESEECLCESNVLDPHNSDVWGYLAAVCLKQGRDVEADQALGEAMKLGLDCWEVYQELGVAWLDLEKLPSAEQALRQALDLLALAPEHKKNEEWPADVFEDGVWKGAGDSSGLRGAPARLGGSLQGEREAELHLKLAETLLKGGYDSEAIAEYEEVQGLDASDEIRETARQALDSVRGAAVPAIGVSLVV